MRAEIWFFGEISSRCSRLCCICLRLLLFALAAQAFAQAPEPQTSLRGMVINSMTRYPIGHALVVSTDNRLAMFTDNEGRFEFSLPKPAEEGTQTAGNAAGRTGGFTSVLVLTARKPGFLDDPYGRSQVDGKGSGDLTIVLVPEGVIRGHVSSSEAELSHVSVQLLTRQVRQGRFAWVQAGSATANSKGEFRMAELLPGSYKLLTNEAMEDSELGVVPGQPAYGFPPVYYAGVTDPAAATAIELAAGETVQADIPLSRQTYYPVSIAIENADPAGVNPTVSVLGHRGPGYTLGYDSSKQKIEGLLPKGSYLIEAESYGAEPRYGSAVLVVEARGIEGKSLTMTRKTSITAEVHEEFTNTQDAASSRTIGGRSFGVKGPRSYLTLGVENADEFARAGNMRVRPAAGPNDTSMVIENITPGKYWLEAQTNHGYVASATMGGVDLLREPFVVGAGSNPAIDVVMRDDTAEISGSIGGSGDDSSGSRSGISRPSAWVYCVPLAGSTGQYQQIWVTPEGKFGSAAMVPGAYRVMVFRNQQREIPYRDPEAMRAFEGLGKVVQLSPGQKTTVQAEIIAE